MTQLLDTVWSLLTGVLAALFDLTVTCTLFVWDFAHHLHVHAPRLEGLLVGVLLAWVLLRRERHALLRVLSAPVKLILDILDLVWDQALEVLGDIKGTAVGWLRSGLDWSLGLVRRGWSGLLGRLASIRDKLLRRSK